MTEKYILKNKIPVPVKNLFEWAEWLETADRQIGKDKINKTIISTVFLGVNHNFQKGKPLLFETMIFGGKHDQYQERYSTWEEAKEGHKKAVKLVKSSNIMNNILRLIIKIKT